MGILILIFALSGCKNEIGSCMKRVQQRNGHLVGGTQHTVAIILHYPPKPLPPLVAEHAILLCADLQSVFKTGALFKCKECRLSIGQVQSLSRQLDKIKVRMQENDPTQGLWVYFSKAQEMDPTTSFVPPCCGQLGKLSHRVSHTSTSSGDLLKQRSQIGMPTGPGREGG